MSRKKATLLFDPNRRPEQLTFVTARTEILHDFGDQAWVAITEAQAERFAEQGILVQLFEEADLVEVPAAVFDPVEEAPRPPAALTATAPTNADTAYHLVQFIVAPQSEWIAQIEDEEEIGGVYIQDLPVHVVVFRLTTAQAEAVRALAFTSWVGLYHPAYALSYELAGREEPFSALELSDLQVDPAQVVATETGTLEVSFFDDLTSASMHAAVEAAGATVQADTGYNLVVDIAPEAVPALLRIEGVWAVERHLQVEVSNQRAGIIVGANQVRNFRNRDFLVNLDGTGEIAGVIDSGFDGGGTNPPVPADPPVHADLAGRIQFNNLYAGATPANTTDNPPRGPHGTHVVGTLAGNGAQTANFIGAPPPNPSTIRGIAPACQIIFHGVFNAGVGGGILDFRGFMQGFTTAHNAGARVHNNSWGGTHVATLITNNIYTNGVSAVIDRFAFLNPEDLLLFAAGNDERDNFPKNGTLDMRYLAREAVAKNILCIGASENTNTVEGFNGTYHQFAPLLNAANPGHYNHPTLVPLGHQVNAVGAPVVPFSMSNNANQMALFSSRGRVATPGVPAARRRIRPDLVAPGTNIISTGPVGPLPFGGASQPNTAPVGFYLILSGTSFATPIVAGAAVLTRQYYRDKFAQLRRPVLLEQVPQFVDLPTVASHTVGCVLAWVRRDTAAGQNNIVAARHSRALVRLGNIVPLQTDVGDHPAPMLARHGDNTLLLHRAGDNTIRLSLYDANLAPVTAFGTNGTVTLAPASRSEDTRSPAFMVHGDHVAVVWNQTGGNTLVFQRFRADTGAVVDATPQNLGAMTQTSSHRYILRTNTHYAVVWAHVDGPNHQLRMRQVDDAGAPVGTQPTTLLTQTDAIREPHFVFDTRRNRCLVVWTDSTGHQDGSVRGLFVDAAGSPDGASITVVGLPFLPPATLRRRRPFVALHRDTGYVLFWEDNTQNDPTGTPRFDLYVQSLGNNGLVDLRINDPLLPFFPIRISDTPQDTGGFTCLVDGRGMLPAWQSNDEINADLRAVYALNMTSRGTFEAQEDPNTPMIQSGRYVRHRLNDHNDDALSAVAMVWAGGDYFHLREEPDFVAELHMIQTNADGLPVGDRQIDLNLGFGNVALHWADTRLIAAYSFGHEHSISLFDGAGNPENTFGTNGRTAIREVATSAISPQLGHRGSGNAFRMIVAYGRRGDPTHTIRYAVLNRQGNFAVAPRDLTQAAGTARHGWFHYVHSDAPRRSIAAWHRRNPDDNTMDVFINRFQINGTHGADIPLTALPGDSLNAVIAPRPVLFQPPVPAVGAAGLNSRRREYGVAWQYHPAPGDVSEIRFSRLNRDGTVAATRDVQVVSGILDAEHPQLVWHTNGYGLAWLVRFSVGGGSSLRFTIIDQDGARVNLAAPGAAAAPAPDYQVSAYDSDVKNFQLVWNGRSFRITWTEGRDSRLRHMQTTIAVPRQPGQVGYDQPYHHPTSALIRATLINGATNMRQTALPNFGTNPNDGYGWGRINLRQSLVPRTPVTYYARDDASVASGRTVRYRFRLAPDTRLLRVTLVWTDPPRVRLMNNLNLRLTTPGGGVFVGNRWGAAGTPQAQFSNPLPNSPPANPFEGIHPVEQIVIPGAPTLAPGDYIVEVIGGAFRNSAFQQFLGQPFSLVFVGSGVEFTFPGLPVGLPVY